MSMWYIVLILMVVASTSFGQKDYCREGAYGNNCELTCPSQCRPLQTFPCDKNTGRCSEGCNSGYYGDQCDKICSCPSGICFQEGGECYGSDTTTYNTTKRVIYTTTPPVHNPKDEKVEAGWRTAAIIFIVFFILLLGGVLVMFLNVSRNWKKQGKPSSGETTTENFPLVQAGSDVEAAGGGSKETQSTDDLSGNTPKVHKGSAEVEELKVERDLAQTKCEEMKRQLASFEFEEKEIHRLFGLPSNSTNLFMGKDKWLQCPHLRFDKERVNVKFAQIYDNMVLQNIEDKNPQNMRRTFQKFQGTTCTAPLVKTGFYQYFEAKFDIIVPQPFGEGKIAQFALCDKEPDSPFIVTEKPFFVVDVASSKEHKLCLLFINNGKTVHMKELMNNMTHSTHKVHIGIRLKKDLKRIHIFEFTGHNFIPGFDINIGNQIWPMFGVCAQNEATVSVQLIAGRDIEMDKEKKEMIRPKKL